MSSELAKYNQLSIIFVKNDPTLSVLEHYLRDDKGGLRPFDEYIQSVSLPILQKASSTSSVEDDDSYICENFTKYLTMWFDLFEH